MHQQVSEREHAERGEAEQGGDADGVRPADRGRSARGDLGLLGCDAPRRRRHHLELAHQLLGALGSVRRVLREAAHDQRGERGRHTGAVLGHGVRRGRHLGREHALGRQAAEREPAREQLVAERPDGVQIGAVVHGGIAGGLLRRHVGRCAERHAEGSQRAGAARARYRLGDAEVGDERVLPREEHVVGLHVAVDDPVAVRVGEGIAHIAQDPHCVAHGQLALVRYSGAQRLAGDVGHDIVQQVAL